MAQDDEKLSVAVENFLAANGIEPPARFDGELLNPFDESGKFYNQTHGSKLREGDPQLAEILISKALPVPFAVRNLSKNPWTHPISAADSELQDEVARYRPALAAKLREEAKAIATEQFLKNMSPQMRETVTEYQRQQTEREQVDQQVTSDRSYLESLARQRLEQAKTPQERRRAEGAVQYYETLKRK